MEFVLDLDFEFASTEGLLPGIPLDVEFFRLVRFFGESRFQEKKPEFLDVLEMFLELVECENREIRGYYRYLRTGAYVFQEHFSDGILFIVYDGFHESGDYREKE